MFILIQPTFSSQITLVLGTSEAWPEDVYATTYDFDFNGKFPDLGQVLRRTSYCAADESKSVEHDHVRGY